MSDDQITVTVTGPNIRLLWVHGDGGIAHLLQGLAAAVLAVEDQVIDLYFHIDDNGEIALGAYLETEA